MFTLNWSREAKSKRKATVSDTSVFDFRDVMDKIKALYFLMCNLTFVFSIKVFFLNGNTFKTLTVV